ncbi:hypothetical protein ACP70R_048024 [Stipagrostis hirtigluma subsp. patula]
MASDRSMASQAAAATTRDSRWVMLDEAVCRKTDSVVAGAKTMAESATSAGQNLRIYFGHTAPPASSSLYYDWAGSAPSAEEYAGEPEIIAAHGDSVLFEMNHKLRRSSTVTSDYFVYRAGVARPPSLSLLPEFHCGTLNKWKTGILRRGDDELLVVQLDLVTKRRETAHLCVLQLSRREWELKPEVPIVLDKGTTSDEEMQRQVSRSTTMAIPVGDRFMCWVDYSRSGLLMCNMTEASPKLRYMPLPVIPHDGYDYYDDGNVPDKEDSRNTRAAGSSTLRFVSIDPRCCCGHSPSRSSCPQGRISFTVTTWTLILRTDEEMSWVKEGMINCEEIWALPGYEGLPRVHPEFPVLSSADPDVVCFMVREENFVSLEERKTFLVEFDTRSKALRSVIRGSASPRNLPSKLHC